MVRTAPVAASVAVRSAPGMDAPWTSTILPVKVPEPACASASLGARRLRIRSTAAPACVRRRPVTMMAPLLSVSRVLPRACRAPHRRRTGSTTPRPQGSVHFAQHWLHIVHTSGADSSNGVGASQAARRAACATAVASSAMAPYASARRCSASRNHNPCVRQPSPDRRDTPERALE